MPLSEGAIGVRHQVADVAWNRRRTPDLRADEVALTPVARVHSVPTEWSAAAVATRVVDGSGCQMVTTGQVMVRVMPSICWTSRTTMRPRSFMDGASAWTITS